MAFGTDAGPSISSNAGGDMRKQALAVAVVVLLVACFRPAFGADVARTEGRVEPIWTPGPDAITWTMVTPSPTPTGRSAVGWIGEFVYVFGNESYPTVALHWHVPTESWGNSTPHPSGPSDNWTGAVVGGELYVLGRYNLSAPTNEFWKFTPDGSGTGTWTQLANYPTNVSMLATAPDPANGLVYAAGGYDGGSGLASANFYDVAGDSWVSLPPLPQARLCCGGAFLGGKFYVVAGLVPPGFTYTNTLYEYDPGLGSWSTRATLPQAVGFNWSSVVTDNNYIYQVGGGGGYGSWPALNAVQVYDAAGDSWFLETSLPSANGTNSAIYVPYWPDSTYILSTGGWDGGQYIGQTFKGAFPPTGLQERGSQIPVAKTQCLESYPNPFTHTTTIRWAVGDMGSTTLSIYDLSGRLVRTLLDEPSNSGTIEPYNHVLWDGTDYLGRPVASGVYLLTVQAGGSHSARTVTVLR